MLDGDGELLARLAQPLPPSFPDQRGGRRLDEGAVRAAATRALEELCARAGGIGSICVAATAGTLCFRDAEGRQAADAVGYDDGRHGQGLDRVGAWSEQIPDAARVLPLGDAIMEELGAVPGGTDWTNAQKLGWDPVRAGWPDGAAALLDRGFLPSPVTPGSVIGEGSPSGPARGALLVRGLTDGCAMHLGGGRPFAGGWSVSLGTTVTWKTARRGELPRLPGGAYAHRLGDDLWLPGAASNSGGGVLRALQTGADLNERDATAVLPSGFAAYPLARPGERFPIVDPAFPGFGLPPPGHPALHAAILEGTGYVIRHGIEQLAGGGIPEDDCIRVTGAGASSQVWMSVLASVLRREISGAPEAGAALGAALVALAALREEPPGSLDPTDSALGPVRAHPVDQGLRPSYAGGYSTFLAAVREWRVTRPVPPPRGG